jgi:signal transduction histidine kinase
MLTAERLQMHPDPSVKRAGDLLVRAVERAADLTRRTLEFTRETPDGLPRRHMALRPAVEEAVEQVRPACPMLAVANLVAPDIVIEADRESLVRVLGNLLRNAGEAEARRITVVAAHESGELAIIVADDGPGLPDHVRAALFRPFVTGARRGSTGLGLAIVHDLMRAHGGDVVLLDSGPGGTRFRLTLPSRVVVVAAPLSTGG